MSLIRVLFFFFFQAEDGIRDLTVTGVQTCALPISAIVGYRSPDSSTSSVASQICQRQREPSGLETATMCMPCDLGLGSFFLSTRKSEQGKCPICRSRTCARTTSRERHDDDATASR